MNSRYRFAFAALVAGSALGACDNPDRQEPVVNEVPGDAVEESADHPEPRIEPAE